MKKLIRLFICILALLPISCSGEDSEPIQPPTENPDPNPTPVPDPGEEDEIPASIADSSFYYYNKAFLLEKRIAKMDLFIIKKIKVLIIGLTFGIKP